MIVQRARFGDHLNTITRGVASPFGAFAGATHQQMGLNQNMYPGDTIISADGSVLLRIIDGDLKLTNPSGGVYWQTNVGSGVRLTLQSNGDLNLYRADGSVAWTNGFSTATCSKGFPTSTTQVWVPNTRPGDWFYVAMPEFRVGSPPAKETVQSSTGPPQVQWANLTGVLWSSNYGVACGAAGWLNSLALGFAIALPIIVGGAAAAGIIGAGGVAGGSVIDASTVGVTGTAGLGAGSTGVFTAAASTVGAGTATATGGGGSAAGGGAGAGGGTGAASAAIPTTVAGAGGGGVLTAVQGTIGVLAAGTGIAKAAGLLPTGSTAAAVPTTIGPGVLPTGYIDPTQGEIIAGLPNSYLLIGGGLLLLLLL